MANDVDVLGWLWGFVQFYSAPIVMAAVSLAYFLADRSGSTLSRRALTSAHGLVASVIYAVAIILWISGKARTAYGAPYLLMYSLPVVLMLTSFVIV